MNGYINLIVFILTTIVYFTLIKKDVTFDTLETPPSQGGLAIYALMVILTQFGLNVTAIIEKCGGSASQNIGVAALFTFLPWTLMFGIVIAVLIMFPGFKSAFSDVVGYFYISGKAHVLFSEMLALKEDINSKIEKEPNTTDKQALRSTADVLIKMFGNIGVLINQIVPSNFKDYWTLLGPLMKPANELSNQPLYMNYIETEKTNKQDNTQNGGRIGGRMGSIHRERNRARMGSIHKERNIRIIKGGTPETEGPVASAPPLASEVGSEAQVVASEVTPEPQANEQQINSILEQLSASEFYRNELLKLVISKDNVGEFMWYLYTGILVISIIQYYILSRVCVSDAATMEKNYQKFLENEEDVQAQQEAGQNTTYTIS